MDNFRVKKQKGRRLSLFASDTPNLDRRTPVGSGLYKSASLGTNSLPWSSRTHPPHLSIVACRWCCLHPTESLRRKTQWDCFSREYQRKSFCAVSVCKRLRNFGSRSARDSLTKLKNFAIEVVSVRLNSKVWRCGSHICVDQRCAPRVLP
jgi:hypothetical protein